MYWIAYTHYQCQKFSCLFTDFKDVEKYLKSILECDNNLDFKDTIRQNFTIKCFEEREDAVNFQQKFLNRV